MHTSEQHHRREIEADDRGRRDRRQRGVLQDGAQHGPSSFARTRISPVVAGRGGGSGYAAGDMATARARIRRRQLATSVLAACALTPVFNILNSRAPPRARTRRRHLAPILLPACAITPVFNILPSRASLGEAVQGVVDAVLIS